MTIRPASTVILIRDGAFGPEVFMVRRHIRSEFVGGAYVFPGGTLDPGDEEGARFCAGLDDAAASAILGVASGGLAWWYAAARECFEESGILLASGVDGSLTDNLAAYRSQVQSGTLSLAQLLAAHNLQVAAGRIHYWAHWITPDGLPRRYDTRFFVAVAPEGQNALHDGREVTESEWVRPAAALEKSRRGEWMLVLPTIRNLEHIAGFRTVAEAVAAARARTDIAAIQPVMVRDDAGMHFVIPGEMPGEGPDRT